MREYKEMIKAFLFAIVFILSSVTVLKYPCKMALNDNGEPEDLFASFYSVVLGNSFWDNQKKYYEQEIIKLKQQINFIRDPNNQLIQMSRKAEKSSQEIMDFISKDMASQEKAIFDEKLRIDSELQKHEESAMYNSIILDSMSKLLIYQKIIAHIDKR